MLVFKITSGSDDFYSKLVFSTSTGSGPTITPPSTLSATLNSLVSFNINFADSYYGTTDLYTHTFSLTTDSVDTIIIDSTVIQPVLYWAANTASSPSLSIKVTSIGGASFTSTFAYNINSVITFSTIPTLAGWIGCIVTYTPTYSDSDGNTLTLTASISGIISGTQIAWDPSLGTSATIAVNYGANSVSQTVTLSIVATPSFITTSLNCIVNRICILSYGNAYTLGIDLASISSNYTDLYFGTKMFLYPLTVESIIATITVTTTYGCSFSGSIIISAYNSISVPIESIFCLASAGSFSIISSTNLNDFSISCSSSLSLSGSTISGPCSNANYYCTFYSSETVGYQAFSVSRVEDPIFATMSTLTEMESWSGSLAASNCIIGKCIYSITSSLAININPVTGYATWDSPTDGSFILSITIDTFEFSKTYNITTLKSIIFNTIDQSSLQIYSGDSTSVTISSNSSENFTLSANPTATISGMTISFENVTSSTIYNITITSTDIDTSMNLRLFVLQNPTPYLSAIDQSDLWCEVGTDYELNIAKCNL